MPVLASLRRILSSAASSAVARSTSLITATLRREKATSPSSARHASVTANGARPYSEAVRAAFASSPTSETRSSRRSSSGACSACVARKSATRRCASSRLCSILLIRIACHRRRRQAITAQIEALPRATPFRRRVSRSPRPHPRSLRRRSLRRQIRPRAHPLRRTAHPQPSSESVLPGQ